MPSRFYLFLGVLVSILAFVPIYLLNSPNPEGAKVKFVRVKFPPEPALGKPTDKPLIIRLAGDPKTLNPALIQETTSSGGGRGAL